MVQTNKQTNNETEQKRNKMNAYVNQLKLHPRFEQFHWARQLFADATRLSDRTLTRPDAILDDHLARVWPKRAREMTREDRIMDESNGTEFGQLNRFRRRRDACREPHSRSGHVSGTTAGIVPRKAEYLPSRTVLS
ncbi:hypothetical protein FBUS_08149 [Fasciolopsis buskii]|uniref:Uncharacterized protein n=1 Tax=Fasciolopsis buskii TaxID=27845 RepID=A0A8E0RNF0_9TREM|nr:hypothetical protein FBUS_08149 [Fasciolopsis buski]